MLSRGKVEAIALLLASLLALLRSVKRSRRPLPFRGCPPEVLETIALYIPCPVACQQFLLAFPPSALTHSLQCLLQLLDPAHQNMAVRWPAIFVNQKDRTTEVLRWIAGARKAHRQLALAPSTKSIFTTTFLPSCLHGFNWSAEVYDFSTIDERAHTPDAIAFAHETPDAIKTLTLNLPDTDVRGLVDVLPTLSMLTHLSLQGHVEDMHTIPLFQALCWLPHLQSLHLNHAHLDDALVPKVARVVRCCTELEDLDVSSNQLTASGIIKLLRSLHTSPKLTAVNLTQNPYVLKDLVPAAPAVARLAGFLKTISLRVDRDDMTDAFPFLRALQGASRDRIVVMMVGSGTLSAELAREYHQLKQDLRRAHEPHKRRCQLYLFGRDPWPKRDLIAQHAGCAMS
ncbi:hypothetical protein ACHHYP_04750 [Achlya hypogyna]|uniref:Secreted protein n=1 Tax=Achlya hypogyna TaxID=1202772 RepID=A0A0A7CNK4_ACHHY|nr:secreted protein [Achlya hypogyna]OQR91357.1 hypothetical protein ACHHYP_04750 [Achlya hypogyna]